MNIWGVLSKAFSPWVDNEKKIPRKCSPYIQVSDVLCYKLISIIYRTSLLQNSLKVIISWISLSYWNYLLLWLYAMLRLVNYYRTVSTYLKILVTSARTVLSFFVTRRQGCSIFINTLIQIQMVLVLWFSLNLLVFSHDTMFLFPLSSALVKSYIDWSLGICIQSN